MSKPKKQRYSAKQLSNHLRELAAEIFTIDDDGAGITRGEQLARVLWERALGYSEKVKVEDKKTGKKSLVDVEHKPEAWALQMVYDRMEGRIPQAAPEEKTGRTVKEKISEVMKDRVNALMDSKPKRSGPPRRSPKR